MSPRRRMIMPNETTQVPEQLLRQYFTDNAKRDHTLSPRATSSAIFHPILIMKAYLYLKGSHLLKSHYRLAREVNQASFEGV